MKKGFYPLIITVGFTILFGLSQTLAVLAESKDDTLKLGVETKFTLKNKEEKVLLINLKKDEFTEIFAQDNAERSPYFTIIAPSGKDVSDNFYSDVSAMFIAHEDGKYQVKIHFDENENNTEAQVTVSYKNVFMLPKSAKLKRQKKVNGYDVKVYNTSTDEASTFLLIEKNGKLKEVLKGGSLIDEGFNFLDDPTRYDSAEGKKSAMLFRTTIDKTGDGTPDIAVGFFTGGAHCCFDLHFYELGTDGIKKLKVIEGEDSDILAIDKNPKGGLILKTGDSNFAYWLTSFAGSPIPSVVLTYQNGEFRPDVKLMKKSAPSALALKQKAAKDKKEIDLEPYTNEEDSHFLNAFWGEMLDLMYSGNETAAWQYFDMVWDKRKAGKDKFKADFLRKLNESKFWSMMRQSN